MNDNIFEYLSHFDSDSELFLNLAFFRYIELLGYPLINKLDYLSSNKEIDFDNLYYDCELSIKDKVLKIKNFNNTDDLTNELNTFIYNKVEFTKDKFVELKGNDNYDSRTNSINLSNNTIKTIGELNIYGRKTVKLKIGENNIIKDPILRKLINLYYKYMDLDGRGDFFLGKDGKMLRFSEKIKTPLKSNVDFYEKDINGDNRIKYENLERGEIYFIEGPPGTGKTTTIKRLIEENEKKEKFFDKIIVSSYVHVAVNNIIERILKNDSDFIKEYGEKYGKFYDLYQYSTVLYSDRELSKIKNSELSRIIELDKLIESDEGQDEVLKRKKYSNELIEDFNKKINQLYDNDEKISLNNLEHKKIDDSIIGEKFKRVFKCLNSDEKNNENDYLLINKIMLDLSRAYYKFIDNNTNNDWALNDYVEAVKDYSNVIFCSLSKLSTILDNQKFEERILVIIDEASKSNIINYLLLLEHMENITIIIMGDPNQLNQSLVFQYSSELDFDKKVMTYFSDKNKINRYENFHMAYKLSLLVEKFKECLGYILKSDYNDLSDIQTRHWSKLLSSCFYEDLFAEANDSRKRMLNIHRRSRNEIFDLSKELYNDLNGSKYVNESIEHDDNKLIPGLKVVSRFSSKNIDEASEQINNLIKKWIDLNLDSSNTLGVISFYTYQKNELEKKSRFNDYPNVSYYTIDSSQGEEFDTVILYLNTRKDDSSTITPFFKEYQRINVAVSRAKEQLIIIEGDNLIHLYKNEKKKSKFHQIMDKIHNIEIEVDYE